MARPRFIDEETLISSFAGVFRDVGFEGASLSDLSRVSGLRKASLYHRFPRGKQQMAEEVLASALGWLQANVLSILNGEGDPRARLSSVAAALGDFYQGGRKACLLNMLSSPREKDGPFAPAIRAAFKALIDAFAKLARDSGVAPSAARLRAERTVMLLQGSLVVSRGLGSAEPFQTFLRDLPNELLAAGRR